MSLFKPVNGKHAQAAVDFLVAYGFAILIISIAVFAVLQLGIFDYSGSPQYCYANPPFSCIAYSINSSGGLALALSQSSGGTLTINGIACSSSPNATKVAPAYRNVNVLPNIGAGEVFYPGASPSAGSVMAPGAQVFLHAYCYSGGGSPASAAIGSTFTGYIWINYTFSGLPSAYHNIVRAASVSMKYT